MTILTLSGEAIDVTKWVARMKDNVSRNRDVFERTPIGTTAQGGYWWWDEDKNPPLNKDSVIQLKKALCPSPT